jgi:uncharacterized protein YuzE
LQFKQKNLIKIQKKNSIKMKNYLLPLLVQYFIISNCFCENSNDGYYKYRERVLESSYHGLIKENETLVEITPEIKIDETKKICGFEIEKNLKKKIPFEIELISNLGILRATKSLNCERERIINLRLPQCFAMEENRRVHQSTYQLVMSMNLLRSLCNHRT